MAAGAGAHDDAGRDHSEPYIGHRLPAAGSG